MAKRGIDISEHQGNINLSAIKNQIDFVIIRAGFGRNYIDPKMQRNAQQCIQLGIPFGFYWYSYALDEAGARKEAEKCLKAIAPYKDSYSMGIWFDMEDADGYKKKHGMPSNATLQNMCRVFCEEVEANGYYVGIYASSSWFRNQLNHESLNRYDKWVAQWPTSCGKQRALAVRAEERTDLSLWQFTSQGNYNGTYLDSSYAYKDYPNLIRGTEIKPDTERPIPNKSVETIAKEVMYGLWGNGEDRRTKLECAGYNYNEVQDKVNELWEQENKPQYDSYTVVSGDTLSGIGAKTKSNWGEIARINGIKSPYIIYPGQVLKIPNPNRPENYKVHTVVAGESLSSIAKKYGTSWRKIYEDNKQVIGSNPNRIYIGQKLIIK